MRVLGRAGTRVRARLRRHRVQCAHLTGGNTQHQPGVAYFHHHDTFSLAHHDAGDDLEQAVAAAWLQPKTPHRPTAQEDQRHHQCQAETDLQQTGRGMGGGRFRRRGGHRGQCRANRATEAGQHASCQPGEDGATSSIQFLNAFGRRDDVGQSNAELVVHHHHFALRNQVAVDQDVHRLAGQAVEFDDGALRQLQQTLDGDAGAPQFRRQLHRERRAPGRCRRAQCRSRYCLAVAGKPAGRQFGRVLPTWFCLVGTYFSNGDIW